MKNRYTRIFQVTMLFLVLIQIYLLWIDIPDLLVIHVMSHIPHLILLKLLKLLVLFVTTFFLFFLFSTFLPKFVYIDDFDPIIKG